MDTRHGETTLLLLRLVPKLCSVCLCKVTRSIQKQAAASLPVTCVPAVRFPSAGLYQGWIEIRTVFLLQGVHRLSHRQGSSELTKCFTSNACHSSESLKQTIIWFLYFISNLSLFPQESQISIENLAMGSWFFQRSHTRPPQAGLVGKSKWI